MTDRSSDYLLAIEGLAFTLERALRLLMSNVDDATLDHVTVGALKTGIAADFARTALQRWDESGVEARRSAWRWRAE